MVRTSIATRTDRAYADRHTWLARNISAIRTGGVIKGIYAWRDLKFPPRGRDPDEPGPEISAAAATCDCCRRIEQRQ